VLNKIAIDLIDHPLEKIRAPVDVADDVEPETAAPVRILIHH
jgi:hypothetical protein